MEATFQIQLFVSAVIVLGAALAALMCDYLKVHNERLREENRDLRARNEEQERRSNLLAQLLDRRESKLVAPGPEGVTAAADGISSDRNRPSATAAHSTAGGNTVHAMLSGARRKGRKSAAQLHPSIREIAGMVEQRIERHANPPAGLAVEATAVRCESDQWKEVVIEFGQARKALDAKKHGGIAARETEAATPHRSGIQGLVQLRARMEANQPFRGVVLVVGTNRYEDLKTHREYRPQEVSRVIEELTEGRFQAYRIAEDEHLVVMDGLGGPAARRKTSEAAERLWDFQLRNLGSAPVAFSWGAYETAELTLAQAVENARHEMLLNRRSRGRHTGRKEEAGKLAVNL